MGVDESVLRSALLSGLVVELKSEDSGMSFPGSIRYGLEDRVSLTLNYLQTTKSCGLNRTMTICRYLLIMLSYFTTYDDSFMCYLCTLT